MTKTQAKMLNVTTVETKAMKMKTHFFIFQKGKNW